MRSILIIISLFFSFSLTAQKQFKELYNLNDRGMKNSGWHFSPGITYMIPSKGKQEIQSENIGVSEEITAKGKIGLYAEVGRHHLFENLYFLDHLDYGISYKKLKGIQKTEIICETCDVVPPSESLFKDNFAGAYVNFSNIWQISDYNFIQNGLGVNADYRFKFSYDSNVPDIERIPDENYNPDPLQVQLHYKLSFGVKAEKGVFIVPSIEVPILNVLPFDGGRSTLIYFDSGYRPIIFSVKFMFLSKRKSGDCVGSGDGKSGHKLWDKKMKR